MIYIKNNTEIQTIFIPRTELQSDAYNATIKTYEDGYKDGFGKGKQYQKDQLLNLYVTENGEYEREDGWGIVTVDIPQEELNCDEAYNEGYSKGKDDGYVSGYVDGQNSVKCPEGGSCNLGEGKIYLTASDAGFYELYAADDGYDGWSKFYVTLEGVGAIKVHKASDLLDAYNNGGQIDYGAYYYVGGKITDIQEVSVGRGNATYTLDNGFSVYRGKWIDKNPFWDENQINVGAYIVVYGIIQDYKGTLRLKSGSQVIAYQECEGGEIVSCNIQNSKWVRPSMADRAENGDIYIYPDEGFDAVGFIDLDPSDIYNEGYNDAKAEGILLEDKWMTPSMADRDGNGYVVVEESEGFDGLSRVVIDPTTIYNEGVEEGRNQGGGSGDCNIQNQKYITLNGEWEAYYPDEGYDGVYEVVVDASRKAEEWREEGRNGVRDKLQSIEITENGRYSVDDSELVNYIEFDGNSYFDTNIPFGKNTKIEVAITKTTYEEDEQFIGVAHFDLLVAETYGGFGIVAGAGLAYGVFGGAKTHNIPFSYEEEQILTLDRNGLNSSLYDTRGWIDESGLVDDSVYGQTIGIGKIKSSGDGWVYRGLNGRIRYVKIWTDGNDDSTLVTFIPKNMAQGGFGLVNSDGIEYDNISNLGEGTTTFISEWERKYGEGWKEINVNVQCVCPSVQEQMNDFYFCPITVEDSGFGERAKQFSVLDETMISNDEGILYSDKYIYLPSSNNKNIVKTKVKVDRMVFPFEERDSMYMGKIWVDGVGTINFNGLYFNNLYYLETSEDCGEIKLTNCTLTNLNTLVIRSAFPLSYNFRGTIFKDGGVLKVNKNFTNAEELRAALGSGWTIEYL